ncbi:MAG: hypothetical protein LBR29_01040 [Methylobacteriaceae bacterium]|jgi:hypothetical protein|nr:hypothetical protein [Methylobacteriaceae bacterium]
MIRLLNILAITALILSAGFAYSIKYETLRQHEEKQALQESVRAERETISTLNAEWAMLNSPERLQRLADKYLSVQQLDVRQLARTADLAPRPEKHNSLEGIMGGPGAGGATTPANPTSLYDLMRNTTTP